MSGFMPYFAPPEAINPRLSLISTQIDSSLCMGMFGTYKTNTEQEQTRSSDQSSEEGWALLGWSVRKKEGGAKLDLQNIETLSLPRSNM